MPVRLGPSHGSCSKKGVHKKTLLLLLAFVIVFDFSGCVSMSAQARRERAYRHYVQHQIKQRQKAIARAQKAANRDMKRRMKNLQPSDPQMTTSVESVPEFRPEPMTDMTVAPVTVSASAPVPTDTSIEPQQP
jgi:ATPase subunit of ABC transporter with duplicated ATPase domains